MINKRTVLLARLVDSLLRGRCSPSARHEAAAAMSEIRSFVRTWRIPRGETGAPIKESQTSGSPSPGLLLKLAQKGVQLHNNVRKLPQSKEGGLGEGSAGSGTGDWKTATVAYLRATAASLVSLGSTSSSKDCANLCRLFSKAGDMLVELAGDDIRALEMFDDAEIFFSRLPSSFYGRGQDSERMSLSSEDLVMAMHKASTRKIEVLSRTTGNVDQIVAGYEHQLNMLSKIAPPGLSVSTAMHAVSVGEERFKKGDCRGASRIFRVSLRALGGDLGEGAAAISRGHNSLRRTILFSLAYCYSQSGDHVEAIQCIKHLGEGGGHSPAEDPDAVKFLFAKCKVLCDAGDFSGAHESAEALIEASSPSTPETSGDTDLDLAAARMVSYRDEFSDRSLDLFSMISARWAGCPKEIDAHVALLNGLGMAARSRSERCSADVSAERSSDVVKSLGGRQKATESLRKVAAMAEETAEGLIAGETKKGARKMSRSQVEAALDVLITFAELFQGRKEWKLCAKWCDRAILFVEGLLTSTVPSTGQQSSAMAESSMLAGLLTLRGEMECRLGEFGTSTRSLDRALEVCPKYDRAREVAFWSASRDPTCEEDLLLSRLSFLLGTRPGRDSRAKCEYLTSCLTLVAETSAARGRKKDQGDTGRTDASMRDIMHATVWDGRVMMVQERLLEELLMSHRKATTISTADAPAPHDPKKGVGVGGISEDQGQSGRGVGEHGMRATSASEKTEGAEAMDVDEAIDGGPCRSAYSEGSGARESGSTAGDAGTHKQCGIVKVMALMVDMALKSFAGPKVAGGGASIATATPTVTDASSIEGNGHVSEEATPTLTPSKYAVLSRVLMSIHKALSQAPFLGIKASDDHDINFLTKGCWNLAVKCCGPKCDLPWVAAEVHGDVVGSDENARVDVFHTTTSHGTGLVTLAPGFFKASRHWAEMRSDANVADTLVMRQNCTILGIAAALEIYDHKSQPVDSHQTLMCAISSRNGIGEDLCSATHSSGGEAGRLALLEECQKEIELAIQLNWQLIELDRNMGIEMRSVLLAAQINVLSRLGDVASVRSLVTARESDFQRCSTNLLRHCMQVVEDILDDYTSLAGLCRLCIQKCAEDDPLDTSALGGLYRRLLTCSSSRNEALLVAEEFSARARDLQEGPGMPSDDVDYMAAKCYNLGLQMLEMERPSTAERFVGRALGLLKLGASQAFTRRWGDTMHKVYCSALHAKEGDASKPDSGIPGLPVGRGMCVGGALRMGGAFRSTGIFPIPSGRASDA